MNINDANFAIFVCNLSAEPVFYFIIPDYADNLYFRYMHINSYCKWF